MSACMFGVGLNALWTAGSADGVTSEKQADKERKGSAGMWYCCALRLCWCCISPHAYCIMVSFPQSSWIQRSFSALLKEADMQRHPASEDVHMIANHLHALMIRLNKPVRVHMDAYLWLCACIFQGNDNDLATCDDFPDAEKNFLPPRWAIRSDWLTHPGSGRRYANEALTKKLMEAGDKCWHVCVWGQISVHPCHHQHSAF